MFNLENKPLLPVNNDKGDLLFYPFLLFALLIGTLLGAALAMGLGHLWGIEGMMALNQPGPEPDLSYRQYLRLANGLSHLCTFMLAGLLFARSFWGTGYWQQLGLRHPIQLNNVVLGVLLMASSFPFIQLLYYLNRQLPLPDSLTRMEASAEQMLQAILQMDRPGELLLNLAVMAVLPAIGEELIFRGLLQKRLERYFQRGTIAIWITAFLFSAIHLQFEGFLPRMFLGALLGYLFYWSKNLWIPIFGHFVFNGSQVVGQFFYAEEMEQLEAAESLGPNWGLALLSIVAVVLLSFLLIRLNRPYNTTQR